MKKWSAVGSKEFTHLLLNGGKLCVPDQQHATFLNEYANAVARKEKLFVVESKTPIFRLFVDFDFKPVPDASVITGAIQSAAGIAGYYFDDDIGATVLRKDVESPDKVGVHMTWERVFVDVQTANAFRNHVVDKLVDACPHVDWKDVVDASVYAGSGLRMPWSSKTNAPGVYRPIQKCSSTGVLENVEPPKTAADIRDWIRKTSIRAPDAVPTRTCIATKTDENQTKTTTERIATENIKDHAEVLEKLQAVFPPEYADQTFTGMHRFGDHCVVLRSSSKRCGNKGYDPHHSNTVYFVVLRKGYVYQRCYCRKDVVRKEGVTCAEYVGPYWPVSQDILDGFWKPLKPVDAKILEMLERTRPTLKKRRT